MFRLVAAILCMSSFLYFQNKQVVRRVVVAATITASIFFCLVFTSSQYSTYMISVEHLKQDNVDEEFSHPYFTPSKHVITPIDENYLINGENICSNLKPNTVLILIPSVTRDVEGRNSLRRTWLGSLLVGEWPNENLHLEFRAAFIFGKGNSAADDNTLVAESSVYGDIVQGSFVDSYYNLTRKTLFGLKWATKFCQQARYVMKIDVDTFVHVPKLFKKISYYKDNADGKIFGRMWEKTTPHRTGKWQIAEKDYPVKYYPPYCDGPIYVISGSAVPKLVYTSERMPYLHLEDVFVTGIAARISKVNRINVLQNLEFRDEPEWVCSFKVADDDLPIHLADSEYSTNQIEDIWRCMKNGPSYEDYYLHYRKKLSFTNSLQIWNMFIFLLLFGAFVVYKMKKRPPSRAFY